MPMRREDCLDVGGVRPQALNSGFTPGAMARNLSTESKTGGEHLVLELKAGWSLPRGRNEADIDLYVLEGSLEVGGERWMQGCYGYFPAGMAWGPLSTSAGCSCLPAGLWPSRKRRNLWRMRMWNGISLVPIPGTCPGWIRWWTS